LNVEAGATPGYCVRGKRSWVAPVVLDRANFSL
jgi:hypothetical protein